MRSIEQIMREGVENHLALNKPFEQWETPILSFASGLWFGIYKQSKGKKKTRFRKLYEESHATLTARLTAEKLSA